MTRLLLTLASLLSVALAANPTNPVKLLSGVVTDAKTGRPVDGGRLVVYQGTKPDPVAHSRINPTTGAFQVVLGPAADYRFVLRSHRYLPTEIAIKTPSGMNYEELVRNLTMEPIPVGQTLYAGRAFTQGSAEPGSDAELAKALAFLRESQAATITITVLPDPAAKPSIAPRNTKKKKGEATNETAAAPGTGEAADGGLIAARVQALKSLMQRESISLTRITWVTQSTAAELQKAAARRENLVITISGVDIGEVDEDDA